MTNYDYLGASELTRLRLLKLAVQVVLAKTATEIVEPRFRSAFIGLGNKRLRQLRDASEVIRFSCENATSELIEYVEKRLNAYAVLKRLAQRKSPAFFRFKSKKTALLASDVIINRMQPCANPLLEDIRARK